MADTGQLFTPTETQPQQGYPKSWSAKQRRNASMWLHPMGHLLAGNGESCGTCCHAMTHRVYRKCEKSNITFGPGTDIRLYWPACVMWEDSE